MVLAGGDVWAVHDLVDAGADPDTPGPDGLPVLCAAVAAYDDEMAAVLVECGADPDRTLPDGTTPLLRAVALGSPAVVGAVLGREPLLRLPETARERALSEARTWYDAGAVAELRRRTGATGTAAIRPVQDDGYGHVEEVALGGHAVRAGHGAVLTDLERAFQILTPVDELVARAVRHPDDDHVDRSACTYALVGRHDEETWAAVVAHGRHPSPAHRRFAAHFLFARAVTGPQAHLYEEEAAAVLTAWAAAEPDAEVLETVLLACSEYDHAGLVAAGLRHTGHPDPRVRSRAAALLHPPDGPAASAALRALARDPVPDVRGTVAAVLGGGWRGELTPGARRELLTLVRDPDPGVRLVAASALSESADEDPAVLDALAALLDDLDDPRIRLEGGYGLARRNDPRTQDAYARIGPLDTFPRPDHRLNALWDWKWHKEHPHP
ncbi:HEAT repeat domain-containing protein [Streptomyces sp. NPDC101118]|uniref:HEAT repeat domain-containing protein n=1 Tax=Streptomyces sp. NPDC101118 TaxID=3366109 RepID=UPI00382A1850